MGKVIALRSNPDVVAQELWYGVATAADTIEDLIGDIPAAGVQGEETRNELHQAQLLLGQAAEVLERTRKRYEDYKGSGVGRSP